MTGIFAVDKPAGFTSFDVVAKLRGILGTKKIGHGGTLDPMATGVLPIFVGKATRAADILPDQTKRYTATGLLGIKTDTGDVTGDITERRPFCCSRDDLRIAVESFLGKSEQIPPMYSAVRVNGRRLYEIARQGGDAKRNPRPVEIFLAELLDFDPETGSFCMDVHCTKGTYIRTLAEDIAGRLGTVAALSALRRTQSGPFQENGCVTLGELQTQKDKGMPAMLRPVESVFLSYPAVSLDEAGTRAYLNGVRAAVPDWLAAGIPVRVKSGETFLGLAENRNGELVKTCQFV